MNQENKEQIIQKTISQEQQNETILRQENTQINDKQKVLKIDRGSIKQNILKQNIIDKISKLFDVDLMKLLQLIEQVCYENYTVQSYNPKIEVIVSGSSILWALEQNPNWTPNDLDIFVLGWDIREMRGFGNVLQKNGYNYTHQSNLRNYFDEQHEDDDISSYRVSYSVQKDVIENPKKIQIICTRDSTLDFDFEELENLLGTKIFKIKYNNNNTLTLKDLNKLDNRRYKRLKKYQSRGYKIVINPLYKTIALQINIMRYQMQKGGFVSKRIKDYIYEINNDFIFNNFKFELKSYIPFSVDPESGDEIEQEN